MPLPLAPVAAIAARYGTVALIAYAVTRRIERSQTQQASEDALDRVEEGLAAHRPTDRKQINAQGRWKRTIRFGRSGSGFEVDVTALGRIKFRKV